MSGCSATCDSVASGFVCPDDRVGPCSDTCGNQEYEGAFPAIGKLVSDVNPEEFCDDGNNDDGDGCSRMCELEDPTGTLKDGTMWDCTQVFLTLRYEFPIFTTYCQPYSGPPARRLAERTRLEGFESFVEQSEEQRKAHLKLDTTMSQMVSHSAETVRWEAMEADLTQVDSSTFIVKSSDT
jgi:cysteine-rich repeat protein